MNQQRRAHIVIPLHCRECRSADFRCPFCGIEKSLGVNPQAPEALLEKPNSITGICTCGAALAVTVEGFEDNPNGEHRAVGSQSEPLIGRLEQALQVQQPQEPSPPATKFRPPWPPPWWGIP